MSFVVLAFEGIIEHSVDGCEIREYRPRRLKRQDSVA